MPTLGELCGGPTATVEAHEPIARAAERMFDLRVSCVCVYDEDGRLGGIFTERDLLRACAAGVDTHASTVGKWMTSDPIVATASDDAEDAMAVMLDWGFRHLPVLGEGGLLGVVSMRHLSASLQEAPLR